MTDIPANLRQFLWHCIKPQKWHAIALIGTAFTDALLLTLVGPYYLKRIVDAVAESYSNRGDLLPAILASACIYVSLFACAAFNHRLTDWIVLRSIPTVRQRAILVMFAHLKRHSSRMFQDSFAGNLSNKIFDVANGAVAILEKLDQAVAGCASLGIALMAMLIVHPAFAAILLVWCAAFTIISMCFLRSISSLSLSYSEHNSAVVGKVVDVIANISNIRLFASHGYEYARLSQCVADNTEQDRAVRRKLLKMRAAQDASVVVYVAIMLGTLIHLAQRGLVSAGDFAMLLCIAVSCMQILWFLADQFVSFTEAWGKAAQGLAVVARPHDVVNAPDAKAIAVGSGQIAFQHVSFFYHRQQNIFDCKNVVIEGGQKVGLVGTSGSGKTTFANLIVRAFDVNGGRIVIDGQDIAGVTQDSLCRNIAVIAQDTSLFHRSLMENIRYGRLDASDEEVINAARLAQCEEFIQRLPQQYQTLVGDRGVKLSGGQRQRIAIARAILKNAPILILDEATSALDTHTENHVQQALHALMARRTTIVIAHRLSTLAEMDRVLVFRAGKIVEDGTVNELIARQGEFSKTWRLQAGGFLPEAVTG